jgi:CDP-diacylglycerol--glycerol-3-phosphate 3-phosphatidyltransferase
MSETPLPEAGSPGSLRGFKARLRQISSVTLTPMARGLYAAGVRPDHITVLGLLFSVAAGLAFWYGAFQAGAVIALASGLCDMLDGQLARVRGTASRFGAFLDSTLDRAADGAILLGIAAYYAGFPPPVPPGLLEPGAAWEWLFHRELSTYMLPPAGGLADPLYAVAGLAMLGLLGSLLVSYTRARAEGLGLDCSVGWFERPERLVLLIAAALFGAGPVMPWALLILMILSFATAAQRVAYVYRQTRGSGRDV